MAGNTNQYRTSGLQLFGGYDGGMMPKVFLLVAKLTFICSVRIPLPSSSDCRFAGRQRNWALRITHAFHCNVTYLLSGALYK